MLRNLGLLNGILRANDIKRHKKTPVQHCVSVK